MSNLRVQIVRFVDDHQPGWVACEFLDASGKCHTLVDKVPIFSVEHLDGTSAYPHPGSVGCEVLARWADNAGRQIVRVTTERPCDIESTEGLFEFVVLASQIYEDDEPQ